MTLKDELLRRMGDTRTGLGCPRYISVEAIADMVFEVFAEWRCETCKFLGPCDCGTCDATTACGPTPCGLWEPRQ